MLWNVVIKILFQVLSLCYCPLFTIILTGMPQGLEVGQFTFSIYTTEPLVGTRHMDSVYNLSLYLPFRCFNF